MAKKAQTTAITKWDAELAKYAEEAAAVEKNVGGGNFISLQGGRMSYKGAEVPGNKMNVIVVHHCLENTYYEGAFNPDSPASPVCYAFGDDEDEMAPHEESTTPQSESCADCPRNQWPDLDQKRQGIRGKECKNVRRLALITEGDMQEIETAETAYLRPPVTSVKAWAGYVRQLKDVMHRPPFAVITQIEVVPDAKSQFKLEFTCVQPIDDGEALQALRDAHEKAKGEIAFPYAKLVQVEPAPRGRSRAPRAAAPAPAAAKPARAPRAAAAAAVAQPRAAVAVGARKAPKY